MGSFAQFGATLPPQVVSLVNERGALRRLLEWQDRLFGLFLGLRQSCQHPQVVRQHPPRQGLLPVAKPLGHTGPVIEDTARSLINGLIREGRLEKDGDRICRVS
jgi:hypothetical protein